MSRYPFDTIGALVALYLLFLILFLGVRAMGGDMTERHVLVFSAWVLLAFAYSSVAIGMVEEALTGTLEQLAMSPRGLLGAILIDFWVKAVFFILQVAVFLILAMATTSRWLHVDILSTLPLLLTTMTGVLGVALVMGGLALVSKRVAGVSALVQLAIVLLVAAPVDTFPVLKLLPITLGYHLLEAVMVGGRSIVDLPTHDLALLLLTAAAYLVIGVAVFRKMDVRARDRGLLGQY